MMFQKKHIVVTMIALTAVLAGCFSFNVSKPKLVIINVLDKAEFEDCHIKDSINITFDDFEAAIPSLSKNDYYVIYCANYMCMSSGFCAKLLIDAGFKHVWAYEGGMAEWYQKGYPYQGPAESDYLQGENNKMSDDEDSQVPVISADELLEKIEQSSSAK